MLIYLNICSSLCFRHFPHSAHHLSYPPPLLLPLPTSTIIPTPPSPTHQPTQPTLPPFPLPTQPVHRPYLFFIKLGLALLLTTYLIMGYMSAEVRAPFVRRFGGAMQLISSSSLSSNDAALYPEVSVLESLRAELKALEAGKEEGEGEKAETNGTISGEYVYLRAPDVAGAATYAITNRYTGAMEILGTSGTRGLFRAFKMIKHPSGKVALKSMTIGQYVSVVRPPPGMMKEGGEAEAPWTVVANGTAPNSATQLFDLQDGGYLYSAVAKGYVTAPKSGGVGVAAVRSVVTGQDKDAEGAAWRMETPSPEDMELMKNHLRAVIQEEKQRLEIVKLPPSTERRVVSYGLYGDKDKYIVGAFKNTEAIKTFFPGWTARFYVDNTVPEDVVTELKARGAEVVPVEDFGHGGIAGMFWRFLIADDPTVDRYLIRDTDSRLNARERMAVEDWITSGKSAHIMRDHPFHCIAMLGATWGAVKGAIKDISSKVSAWSQKGDHGQDQNFLGSQIYPAIAGDLISHDGYCCLAYGAKPFPTKRPLDFMHVGQAFGADEWEHDRAKAEAPLQCRAKPEYIYG